MNATDKWITFAMILVCSITVVVGGLFAPNTIAGSIAKFVFSVQ